ncbi:class I SAM-dependent methyltransferase [Allochromatium palmeri]|uniref:Class I SAM-dependent methyltransferase n=1 Tax=Allochromatium palmeri TaxID=231048 RepID=A0A6N8EL39_9GAMM|nr:class I SAM-dependent methyltransferase [Allochromatium palmeri]MTW23024.1 class I SAM-dependent methyltransferase [Allochromatium palmeri]
MWYIMRRLHLFELEDSPHLPSPIRNGITDFLEFAVVAPHLYAPIVPRLNHVFEHRQVRHIIDLCAGGGGPWKRLRNDLNGIRDGRTRLQLTDLYPNVPALTKLKVGYGDQIDVVVESVSAMDVPTHLDGFRTLFSSFHHFRPAQARAILADAVEKGQGIAVFESTLRHPLLLLYMLLTPLLVLLATPFIRPFRWSRLFWTYLIPVIPFAVMFDGIVSCLRTYTVAELRDMTKDLGDGHYTWDIGLERIGPLPVGITYLIGYPSQAELG